jgi:hypothetical protein
MKDEESAFPIVCGGDAGYVKSPGISVRDYFAGQAMRIVYGRNER